MKKLIFLLCFILLATAACIVPREQPSATESPLVKTGEETEAHAGALEPADRYTPPPEALAAGTAPRVTPQEVSGTAAPNEADIQLSEPVPLQPPTQTEPTSPSTEPPKTSEKPQSTPQSGDKRIVDGQAEIWIPGFGWIPDNGGGSVGTIATSDGDINKMVGYMGGDDPPRREQKVSPEPYIPTIGDVRVDLQTGIQEMLTEDGWVVQNFNSK